MSPEKRRMLDHPVEFNVLGPVTVVDGAESLNIGGPKQRTVLAMLIASHGRPVSNDVIAEAVYGVDASSRNRRNVQTYVSTLRSIVGDVIVKQGSGWFLDVDRSQIDSLAFENLYESVRTNSDATPEASARLLRDALAIWRGHPYHDIESHGRLDAEVARLNELRVAAQAARIDVDLELGRHADLIGEIEAHIAEHPFSERFRAQHMLALYRAGRQREALRSYEDVRILLVEELGVDPTPELQDLEQRILKQDGSLDVAPRRRIEKKAILVADPGDPIQLARLAAHERDERLALANAALREVVGAESHGELLPAGVATYAVFDDIFEAASAAERVALRGDGSGLRIAIDYGDVEITKDGVSGAPVSRSAVLVSVAHRGQVLLSGQAQQAVVSEGDGAGLRFESLGKHELVGIQDAVPVYQLLVGNPPATFPPLETDQLPVPLPDGGDRSVPGYELREPIGPGSVGMLYRAYQPSVGREVLVELIGRAEASGADFIRQFEADAQRLALLDHPNINPLIDYWRDTDGAFLVYRWHRGGFLDRADGKTLAQVGSALAYAHSYGLVHGSLRPDRVAVDDAGNAYLMGFPVGGVHGKSSPDYPAYIAPEILAGEEPSVATDVYGFGVLAHEAEAGESAKDEPIRPGSELLARALSEESGDRPPGVAELLLEVSRIDGDHPDSRLTQTRNPYKGLAAFHESDADDFFGRADATGELAAALEDSSFLAVVGPSGIGKSSVVRAGLIPALRRGIVMGSQNWVITDMLPGSHPFLELERALDRVAVRLPAEVRERFAERDPTALEHLDGVLPDGADLLVAVDQFEELFTMSPDPAAAAFLELLTNASNSNRVKILVTLRADFLDRPLAYSGFGHLIGDHMVTVAAPSPEELVSAITTPSERMGVVIDAGLAGRMVAEVHDRPGALPLLQHTLTEMFDARSSDLVGVDVYEELGGVSGSLANRAESIYATFDEAEKSAITQTFLRLVAVLEGTAPTRTRVRVDRLNDLGSAGLVESFTRSRLLVADTDPETRTPTIEIAHEALITHWPRLAGWIDAAREDLTLRRRLGEALHEWEESGRDDAYLPSRGRLAQHLAWTSETTLTLTEPEKEFLALSEERDEEERSRRRRRRIGIISGFAMAAVVATFFGVFGLQKADEAEANAAVAAEREQEAEAAAAEADEQRAEAESERQIARGRELSAFSAAVIDEDPEFALMLALRGVDALGHDVRAIAALRSALGSSRTLFYSPVADDAGPKFGDISPDGSLVVISNDDADVEMYDLETGDLVWLFPVPYEGSEEVWGAHPKFVNGGTEVAVTVQLFGTEPTGVGGAYVLSVADGRLLRHFPGPLCGLGEAPGSIFNDSLFHTHELTPEFVAENGCQVTNGELIGHGSLLDVNTGERTPLGEATNVAVDYPGIPAFDGSGSIQLSYDHAGEQEGSAGPQLRAIDRVSGIELANLDSVVADWQGGRAFAVSADGTLGAVGGSGGPENGAIRIFDMVNGAVLAETIGHPGGTNEIRFLDLSGLLVSTGVDGTVKWWDLDSGALVSEIATGTAENGRVRPSEDERRFLVVGTGATTVVSLDAADFTEAGTIEVCDGEVDFNLTDGLVAKGNRVLIRTLCANDDAEHLRVASHIYDYSNEAMVASLPDTDGQAADLSADGRYLAAQMSVPPTESTPAAAGPVVLSDLINSQQRTMQGMCAGNFDIEYFADDCGSPPKGPLPAWAADMDFSPDGSKVAMGAAFSTPAFVWSSDSGEVLASWVFRNGAFSHDGTRFVSAGDLGVFELRDTSDFEVLVSKDIGPDLEPFDLNFSADDKTVVGQSRTDIHFYDAETLERDPNRSILGAHGGFIRDMKVSVDGSMIATAGQDGFVRIWDFETGDLLHEISVDPTTRVQSVDFVNDDRHLLAATPTGPVVAYTLDPDELVDFARSRLVRGFTSTECQLYFPDLPCPTLEEMREG